MFFAPYHAVVRANVKRTFAEISRGRGANAAAKFAENATFQFSGSHAMGGELHGREAVAQWFARVSRLFPDLRVTPLQIVVNGPPWRTTVATRFRVTASLPGGAAYRNEGMQYLRIAWGHIVEDRLYEDTDVLKDALRAIDASGTHEAAASALGEIPSPGIRTANVAR
jgi:ketosteroid isomerase-like protein